MNIRKLTLVLLCALACHLGCSAHDLLFRHLTRNEGLLHDNVTCVAQDDDGYIWIGTHRGINRFDGYTVESYHIDMGKLRSTFYNKVFDLKPYKRWIWIVSEGGLVCFDRTAGKFVDYDVEGPVDFHTLGGYKSLFIDSGDRLWMSIEGKMVMGRITEHIGRLTLQGATIGGQWELESVNRNIPRVMEDDKGKLYISGLKRFYIYMPDMKGEVQEAGTVPGVRGPGILRMNYRFGKLWLGYYDRIEVYQDGTLKKRYEHPNVAVAGLCVGPKNIWMATDEGLMQIPLEGERQGRARMHYHSALDPYSVCSDHQNAMFMDRDDNIWITTWGAGLSYADTRPPLFEAVRFLQHNNSGAPGDDFVSAIHDDGRGFVYVGTKAGGISELQAGAMRVLREMNPPGVKHLVSRSIASDEDYIYSAEGNYVRRIDRRTLHALDLRPIPSSHIFDVKTDRHGQLWAASRMGVVCMRVGRDSINSAKIYSTDPTGVGALSADMVNFIYSDTVKNELLLGTSAGVNRLMLDDQGEVTRIVNYLADENDPGTLSSNYTWAIDKQNDSTYWVGTMGSGLNRITLRDHHGRCEYRAESFGVERGAPSNDVESLQIDAYGYVWCGGRYLSRFDPASKLFEVFYESDGLQSYMFGTASSCRGADGTLYFGGLKGMNYFTPRDFSDTTSYPVFFSRLTRDGLPVELRTKSGITLKYPDRNFEACFTSLTYNHQQHITYRYMLEGHDDRQWRMIAPGTTPEAVYRQLPYGKYRLVVEAGIWNRWSGQPSFLEVTIQPPLWRSTFAWIIYALIVLGVVYLLFRYILQWLHMKNLISVQEERERQKEELMRMKMQFFTNVSHEFKTPLTLINSAISQIEQQEAPDAGSNSFSIIRRNNRKLLNLVGELMDFHRSDISATRLRATYVNVSDIVRQICDEFTAWAARTGITLELQMPVQDINMWADEEHFGKIVSNLLSNAVKYTPAGGTVRIEVGEGNLGRIVPAFEASYTPLTEVAGERQLIIRVRDTGVGITEGSLAKIFERFHQVESKTSKHLGTGIGLALVQSLVKVHRGGIMVSSRRDVGSEFVVALPMDEGYLTPAEKATRSDFELTTYLADYQAEWEEVALSEEQAVPAEGKMTLLLVDDNQEILMVLREYFAEEYAVLMAMDGVDAMEKCAEYSPDIVVSDVMMPRMDGIELCSRLKNQLSTCFIPVVLLTARNMVEQQIEGIESGADAYIPKPFDIKLLAATIRNLLARAYTIREHIGAPAADGPEDGTLRSQAIHERNRQFFDRLEALVVENLMNSDFSVDNLCLELGISRSGLYAAVKNNASVTLGDYIRDIRLNKAAELLRTTPLSISEVVYQVGISSPSYFTRIFKARFGVSPSEYVKKYEN